MSSHEIVNEFMAGYGDYQAQPRSFKGPSIPTLRLVANFTVFVRFFLAGIPKIFRNVAVHNIQSRFLPCTKSITGHCRLCDLLEEEEAERYHEKKILSRWKSRGVVLAYAHLFKHSASSDWLRSQIPVLLVGKHDLEDAVKDEFAHYDPDAVRLMLIPEEKQSLWKLTSTKTGTKVSVSEDMQETMPPLSGSVTPLDKVWFETGEEVSDRDLEWTAAIVMKPGKTTKALTP